MQLPVSAHGVQVVVVPFVGTDLVKTQQNQYF